MSEDVVCKHEQVVRKVCKVVVNCIEEGGVMYYPISYVGEKILLKSLAPGQLRKAGYDMYTKQFKINFGNGGTQNTYCISEDGLKQVLKNSSNINRLTNEQTKAMKDLCKYLKLKMDLKTDRPDKIIETNDNWSKCKDYSFWDRECIEVFVKHNPDTSWRRCNICDKYYPHNIHFYEKDSCKTSNLEVKPICKNCAKGNQRVMYYGDDAKTKMYYTDGEEWYKFIEKEGN